MKNFQCIILFLLLALAGTVKPAVADHRDHDHRACRLGAEHGDIKHVIFIQFDNTHFRRDNPNVPSDLEQMPHLLNFIRENGTLLTNDHTVLISHTAGGILSTLTGVYPDRHGQTVSNSYVRTSDTGSFSFPSSFAYWSDPVSSNGTPVALNMVGPDGINTPAPWVAYTRNGCDVGTIATANIVLENTGTGPNGDITKVFGSGSPQWNEAVSSSSAPPGTAARALAQTDFVGFAIHCALNSPNCVNGQADLLPQEVGGYNGFLGLFGAQEVNPFLTGQPPSTPLIDLLGQPIADPFGQPGFPGFDGMFASVSLAYVAAMQEKGIPVTYAYISDAHDFHGTAGNQHVAFGPGDAGYVQQLQSYDDAFANFFDRLAADGINKHNTLFVFAVDEGDHFVGVQKTDCDGVNTPCVYGANEVGEINSNIDTLVQHQFPSLASQFLGASAPNAFTVHGDDAPTFYLAKKGAGGGQLSQTDPLARQFEQTIASLTAVNPYTGMTDVLLAQMADQTEMKALHMFTAGDPVRNASFVFFADPNYFITDFPASTCETCINPLFAWNHGDIQPEIATTWLGIAGPGVRNNGQDDSTWSDHTDVRPTMLSLLGLRDTYIHDGRVLTEVMRDQDRSRDHSDTSVLAGLYKQINAPFGQFGVDSLKVSTAAISSNTVNDAMYTALENKIADWTTRRDALAAEIKTMLPRPGTHHDDDHHEHQLRRLIDAARTLLQEVSDCAADPTACAN